MSDNSHAQIKKDVEHLNTAVNDNQAKAVAGWLHRDVYNLGDLSKKQVADFNKQFSHAANGLPEVHLYDGKNGLELDVTTNQWGVSVEQKGKNQEQVYANSGVLG